MTQPSLPELPSSAAPRSGRNAVLLLLGCGAFAALCVLGVVVLGVMGASSGGGSIADEAVLKVTLGGEVPEHVPPDALAELVGPRPLTVLEHRSNLLKAAADKRIKGVVVKLEPLAVGWAKVEELRAALLEFKASGKFVVAYAEAMGEKEYALALAADDIYLPPDAPFEFNGLAAEVSHYPGLLEKLGIEVQYFRYGKYKSVSGESFGRKALTEPVKQMIVENLERVFGHFVAAVATHRELPEATVRELVEEGGLKSTWALEKKLIDGLKYWDEVEAALATKVKTDEGKVPFVSSVRYREVSPKSAGLAEGKHEVGLVYSTGLIVAGKGGVDPFSGDAAQGSTPIIQALRRGAEDDDIKAIILRVDSPGGAGLGCDYVRREVERVRAKKPVIVSMSDVAASGGYWVSMDATAIVAQPTTATGSIGIFSVVPSLAGTYEKLGLNHEVFTRGAHADALIGARRLTDAEAATFDADLLASYRRFVELAAKGRGKPVEALEAVAQGRTWYGDQALEHGLVDKLGGFDVAVALAKEKAGLPAGERVKLVPLEKKPTLLAQLFKGAQGDDDDDEATPPGFALVAKVLEATGARALLKRAGAGAFVRAAVGGGERLFPLAEHLVDAK